MGQREALTAGRTFALTELVLPAPESGHALAAAARRGDRARARAPGAARGAGLRQRARPARPGRVRQAPRRSARGPAGRRGRVAGGDGVAPRGPRDLKGVTWSLCLRCRRAAGSGTPVLTGLRADAAGLRPGQPGRAGRPGLRARRAPGARGHPAVPHRRGAGRDAGGDRVGGPAAGRGGRPARPAGRPTLGRRAGRAAARAAGGHSPLYVVADTFTMSWLPYAGNQHMEHSFLLVDAGEHCVVVDGYHNSTQWGDARPGTWRMSAADFDAAVPRATAMTVVADGAPVLDRAAVLRDNAAALRAEADRIEDYLAARPAAGGRGGGGGPTGARRVAARPVPGPARRLAGRRRRTPPTRHGRPPAAPTPGSRSPVRALRGDAPGPPGRRLPRPRPRPARRPAARRRGARRTAAEPGRVPPPSGRG